MIGEFVTVKAGHDKGKQYIIVAEEERFAFLSDGELRPIEKPKKKNKIHLQKINCAITDLEEFHTVIFPYKNEEIKRALKLYRRRMLRESNLGTVSK